MHEYLCKVDARPIPVKRREHALKLKMEPSYCSDRCMTTATRRAQRERNKPVADRAKHKRS